MNKGQNILVGVFLAMGLVMTFIIMQKYGLKNIINTYAYFDPWILLAYLASIAILFAVLAWRWNIILKTRKIRVPFQRVYIYRIIGSAINFLSPGPRVGGEPTQATLVTKHNAEFTESISTIAIDKTIDITTSGILFITGLFLITLKYSFPENVKLALTIGGTIFIIAVGTFYYRMLTRQHFLLRIFQFLRLDRIKAKFWQKNIEGIEEVELIMMEFYKHHRRAYLKCLTISVIAWIVMFVEYKLATMLLGLNLGIPEIFLIVSFVGLAILFPIPMALGVLEAGQVTAFSILKLSLVVGVALAFLVRIKDLLYAIFGLILLAIYGFDFRKVIREKYPRRESWKK